MPTTTWNPEAARAIYKKSVEVCERFFAERKRPESASGQAFYDLCLAEYAVRKHLAEADCFSSRDTLISALKQLLVKPVEPPILPCRADQYLACQRQDIEFEIKVLATEQLPPTEKPKTKPWYQRLFGR